MTILVLGGGTQGKVLAADLAAALPQAAIDVADIRRPSLPDRPNLRWREADCSRPEVVAARLAGYEAITIYVGGVAQDPSVPYGYFVTWSLDDLLAEYTRPARIVRDGKPVTVPVFSDLERIRVEGAGELEAFNSDGLRTLIDTVPGVRDMAEKTLRWPGHAAAVQPLVREGRFLEELRARCVAEEPRDLVAFIVRWRWADGRRQEVTMVNRYDPATRLTAMSRTTALTTAVTAQLMASGGPTRTGVLPLDFVAQDERAYRFVLDGLAGRGVRLRTSQT